MRALAYVVAASALLGAVMTAGDYVWAALRLPHRVALGVAHGAVMCLALGLVIGWRARRPGAGAAAGPVVGVLAALTFYALAPALRWGAMFPAWMLFWILFALLQRVLAPVESWGVAAVRGVCAAVLSGAAFYAISGIWSRPAHVAPNYAWHFAAWTSAFFPGFLSLFLAQPHAAPRRGV